MRQTQPLTMRPAPFARVFLGAFVLYCSSCRYRHEFDFFADEGAAPLAARNVEALKGVYPYTKCRIDNVRALIVALRSRS